MNGYLREMQERRARLASTGASSYGPWMTQSPSLLFVYGTLRQASAAPMAVALRTGAHWVAPGEVRGFLYRLSGYPGLVPDASGGPVIGDLFAMQDSAQMLTLLDDYEECSPRFPEPHEYRRITLAVATADGPVHAWTYAYAWSTDNAELIAGGDFLA
jgi:gamma-glutamylcyclotransferase (GGCT)/AIG2-like uncharacterized protein YtfP